NLGSRASARTRTSVKGRQNPELQREVVGCGRERRTLQAVRSESYILIVEDDDGIGANLQRALATDDRSVAWARTAAAAQSMARAQPPDLVLLDLGLPDGDGVDVCRALLVEQPA